MLPKPFYNEPVERQPDTCLPVLSIRTKSYARLVTDIQNSKMAQEFLRNMNLIKDQDPFGPTDPQQAFERDNLRLAVVLYVLGCKELITTAAEYKNLSNLKAFLMELKAAITNPGHGWCTLNALSKTGIQVLSSPSSANFAAIMHFLEHFKLLHWVTLWNMKAHEPFKPNDLKALESGPLYKYLEKQGALARKQDPRPEPRPEPRSDPRPDPRPQPAFPNIADFFANVPPSGASSGVSRPSGASFTGLYPHLPLNSSSGPSMWSFGPASSDSGPEKKTTPSDAPKGGLGKSGGRMSKSDLEALKKRMEQEQAAEKAREALEAREAEAKRAWEQAAREAMEAMEAREAQAAREAMEAREAQAEREAMEAQAAREAREAREAQAAWEAMEAREAQAAPLRNQKEDYEEVKKPDPMSRDSIAQKVFGKIFSANNTNRCRACTASGTRCKRNPGNTGYCAQHNSMIIGYASHEA